jgi:hypothetical protein
MDYKVNDPNGIFYGDDSGRQVIPQGGTIYQSMIDKCFFRQGCIDNLVAEGKIEALGEEKKAPSTAAAPIVSPSNKKAVIPATKSEKKKGAKK